MPRLSEYYFRTAIVFLIVGIAIGIHMSMSENHNVIGAHAHINLLGWVTSALFGGYFALNPAKAAGRLPMLQYGVYTVWASPSCASRSTCCCRAIPPWCPSLPASSLVTFVGVLHVCLDRLDARRFGLPCRHAGRAIESTAAARGSIRAAICATRWQSLTEQGAHVCQFHLRQYRRRHWRHGRCHPPFAAMVRARRLWRQRPPFPRPSRRASIPTLKMPTAKGWEDGRKPNGGSRPQGQCLRHGPRSSAPHACPAQWRRAGR